MRVAAATIFIALTATVTSSAQSPSTGRSEITVHAEPIAAGIRYTRAASAGVSIGPSLTAGPFHGIAVDGDDGPELREVATLYLAIVMTPAERLRVVLQPIGAALATGNDFGAVYPSAQAGVEWRWGRFLAGTDLRVIRVAGPNGSGDYRVHWIPLRLGRAWAW